jgi:cardiolipin synthase
VAVVDGSWATVGSSNIDPYSLLMAREANIVVRDPYFAGQLGGELRQMIDGGARPVLRQDWERRPRLYKGLIWIAYGIVRVAMGVLGYGGNEWFRGPARRRRAKR